VLVSKAVVQSFLFFFPTSFEKVLQAFWVDHFGVNHLCAVLFMVSHLSPSYCVVFIVCSVYSVWYSSGATQGYARSNDLAGRTTALALSCLLLCFVIVWTENFQSILRKMF